MWKIFTGVLEKYLWTYGKRETVAGWTEGLQRTEQGNQTSDNDRKNGNEKLQKGIANLSVDWIDYNNANDMAPPTYILTYPRIFKVANNIRNITEKSMTNWKVDLTSGR